MLCVRMLSVRNLYTTMGKKTLEAEQRNPWVKHSPDYLSFWWCSAVPPGPRWRPPPAPPAPRWCPSPAPPAPRWCPPPAPLWSSPFPHCFCLAIGHTV